jgi:hypothetical protein
MIFHASEGVISGDSLSISRDARVGSPGINRFDGVDANEIN